MHALVLAAAESSKTAWYIAGGVLALYAVVLAAIGLKRPEFPGGKNGERGVIALTVALVAIAIGSAIATG